MSRVLYKLSASPPAVSVQVLADMLGVTLETRDVDWRNMQHKASEYLQMNPMGTIPVLKDGGFTIAESHAILQYLVHKYGCSQQASLYPSDAETRASIHELMFFNAGLFFIRLKVVALPTLLQGLPGPTPQHISDIESAYGMLEGYLSRHSFVAAPHRTLADLSVGTTAAFMQAIHTLDAHKYPLTAAWLSRLYEDPVFSKHTAPAVAIFDKTLQTFWEINKKKSSQ